MAKQGSTVAIQSATNSATDSPIVCFKDMKVLKGEILGRGANGVVYKASCDGLVCAAKVLRESLYTYRDQHKIVRKDGVLIRKFEQEMELLKHLKHPNIIQYLGFGHIKEEGDLPVILMELMDDSLTHFLESSPQPIPYHIQVNICHDIALALSFLHSNKIIHRDLSSNNVLMINGNRAKVTDFGMACYAMNLESLNLTTCPGTKVYMPPEAMEDTAQYDEKIDCFSFGVIITQIVTRKFPSPGPRMVTINDSTSLQMEVIRRQNHIQIIDPQHSFLPIIYLCLKDKDTERPSAKELCKCLSSHKKKPDYVESMEAKRKERERELSLLKEEHLQDTRDLKKKFHQEKNRLEKEYKSDIAGREKMIEEKNEIIERKNQIIAEKEEKVLHKEETIAAERESKQELREKMQQIIEQHKVELEEIEHRKDFVIEEQARRLGIITGHVNEKKEIQASLESRCSELERRVHKLHTKMGESGISGLKLRMREGNDAPRKIYRFSDACTDGKRVYFRDSRHIHTYDTISREWTQAARIPECPYGECSIVIIQNLLTTIGGVNSYHEVKNELLSLTKYEDNLKWEKVYPDMPTERKYTASVCTETALIVAGGVRDGEIVLKCVEVMNIANKQWSIAADLPEPLCQLSGTLCCGRLYLVGGKNVDRRPTQAVYTCTVNILLQRLFSTTSRRSSVVQKAAKASSLWSRVVDLMVVKSTCVSFDSQLLAVGGEYPHDGTPTSAVQVYIPSTNSWKVIGQLLTPRYLCFAAVLPNSEVIVVGGWEGAHSTIGSVEFAQIK